MNPEPAVPRPTSTTIAIHDRGDGYVIFAPTTLEAASPQLPVLLSRTLESWIKSTGNQVRSSLGIVQNGQTIAIHVWYERREDSAVPAYSAPPSAVSTP